jgi:thiamine-monophosphate kinase
LPSEFELIRKYFTRSTRHTLLGVGDDCALIQPSAGMVLAISTDMLVSGTHFFPDADPFQLGHKVLAVNLSDLAAMGAMPRWCTLAASLPAVDEIWIEAFAQGFFALADKYDVDVIGGDTTRGPLNFCVQIMGETPAGRALTRGGAKVGDNVWVSGELGDAALALAHLQGRTTLNDEALATCLPRLHMPTPRVPLGIDLREVATSCIDVSDGLLADLGHILKRSGVGANLSLNALPHSTVVDNCPDSALAQRCILAGGDDYELCFTASIDNHAAIESLAERTGVRLTCIGSINEGRKLQVLDENGNTIQITATGFDHFK